MSQHLFNPGQSNQKPIADTVIQSEQTFARFQSEMIALPQKDIDTDLIIPAEFLKTTTKEGLGKHVFSNLRAQDPNFPVFKGQRILIAGQNFGCGSSREHAPWALKDAGIDVIISSEFADIFKGNAEKNGLLPVVLEEAQVQTLLQDQSPVTVDLETQTVTQGDFIYKFHINSFAKKRLLENLSDLDYLLELQTDIQNFKSPA